MGNNLSFPFVFHRLGHDRSYEHDLQQGSGTSERHVALSDVLIQEVLYVLSTAVLRAAAVSAGSSAKGGIQGRFSPFLYLADNKHLPDLWIYHLVFYLEQFSKRLV